MTEQNVREVFLCDIEGNIISAKLKSSESRYTESVIDEKTDHLHNYEKTIVELELICNGNSLKAESWNYFTCLQELRKQLEEKNLKIICNGACENVYPSSMGFDMSLGLVAYKLTIGQRVGKSEKMFNILQYHGIGKLATVEEQNAFKENWLKSIQVESFNAKLINRIKKLFKN